MQREQMHRTQVAKQRQQEMLLQAQLFATLRASGADNDDDDPLKRWLRQECKSRLSNPHTHTHLQRLG